MPATRSALSPLTRRRTGVTDELLALMKRKGVALVPTLAAYDAISRYAGWKPGEPDPGREGVSKLLDELRRFQNHGQKLVGYVAEEVRPTQDRIVPVVSEDAWSGIAYREVGNGTGRLTSFRDLYLEDPKDCPEKARYQKLVGLLDRLYRDCLGPGPLGRRPKLAPILP